MRQLYTIMKTLQRLEPNNEEGGTTRFRLVANFEEDYYVCSENLLKDRGANYESLSFCLSFSCSITYG